MDKDLDLLLSRVDICIDQHVRPDTTHVTGRPSRYADLLVVEEADRLSPPPLSTGATASTGGPSGSC